MEDEEMGDAAGMKMCCANKTTMYDNCCQL